MNIQDFYKDRLYNSKNGYQGNYPRVLCVCSAGLMRSATTAWILGNEPYNCNTRAVGSVNAYALIPIDQILIEWADHIVFAQKEHLNIVKEEFALVGQNGGIKRTWILDIPDQYGYRDPELVEIIKNLVKVVGLEEALTKQ